MITDGDGRVGGLELLNQFVDGEEQGRSLSCVRGRKTWRDESHTNCRIWHEEMVLQCLVTASAPVNERLHLLCQHVTQADGIHLDEFRHSLSHRTQQIVIVLPHLLRHVV